MISDNWKQKIERSPDESFLSRIFDSFCSFTANPPLKLLHSVYYTRLRCRLQYNFKKKIKINFIEIY